MSEYLLCTNGLTKEFGRHKAVNKVNLHVKKGSIYGFIGRNGAGKTTCMRMISGLAEPTSGEIELFGYKNQDLKKVRSRISCLIEAPGLYGSMSAYDNLAIKCKLFGMDEKNYIETILDVVGLSKVGKKKAKHFSLGMKQRLGIGLALVGEPDLLVLDGMGFTNYQVVNKNTIQIYERLDESAQVNMELSKAGILVKGIGITSEELEQYFLNLTGGVQNA